MASIIRARALSKNFGDIKAVDDLSFTVEEGDVYGFLGQNGAGKSTTIRMLLDLVRPTAGDIEIMGMNLQRHRKEILQQVGAIIERPDLYGYLSGLENISLFARLSGRQLRREQLMQQLEKVGIADRANSKVRTYSQGMKQRLGLAVALVHDPQLIILDEPTNGLDPQGIADIRQLILHLSRDLKKTVLVSSHLLTEVEVLANRMLILDKGRKKVEGTVADLLDPSKMVVELQTIDNAASFEILNGTPWREKLHPFTGLGALLISLDREQVPAFTASAVELGIGILSIQPRHSLENYFLSLTADATHVHAAAN